MITSVRKNPKTFIGKGKMSDSDKIQTRSRRKASESEKQDAEELDDKTHSTKQDEMATDDENVKLALASLFSVPSCQTGGDGDGGESFDVEDIPEKVRPILLEKWKRLRSDLDSSKPRGATDPIRDNAGIVTT